MKAGSLFFFISTIIVFNSCFSSQSTKNHEEPAQNATSTEVPDMHTSKIALDWNGVYTGVLPCANCEGIETRIVLKQDGRYERSMKYLGKEDLTKHEEGQFEWDESGNSVLLISEMGNQLYQVGENVLFHLDEDGSRITGELAANYRLIKNRVDFNLEDKKWILFELRGQEIEESAVHREGFIEFNMETGRFSGNNTCNNFFGQYKLIGGNRIELGTAGTTRMACPGNELELSFNEVLGLVDSYAITDDILSLNKGKMAHLARFRVFEE
ncbi:MAG: META domain-containing protein [Saprospirales bacterium]|nr:MAG: META domain-containing protein [Saprospirales bacterium]